MVKKLKMTRRGVIGSALAASGVRFVPQVALKLRQKRVLKLVYDKAAGGMRAIDRIVK